jgi:hypothetical protein
VQCTDAKFDAHLRDHRLMINVADTNPMGTSSSIASLPYRSREARDLDHIRYCVLYNVLVVRVELPYDR